MKVLLVDDEMQLMKGVSHYIENENEEWELDIANSGEEALQKLGRGGFDAVVSDIEMPGMSGVELFEKVESDYPAIQRVVFSEHTDRQTALRSVKPMHQFVSKPFEADILVDTLKRGEILQQTIESAEVLAAIENADCMPLLPEVVQQINLEMESENSSARTIADIVSQDIFFAARILKLANSPMFGARRQVADIASAISMVGMDLVRSLAMQHAVCMENQQNDHILSIRQLLDRGFRVALAAKSLAGQQRCSPADEYVVFTAGLMHDVGKLLLLNTYTDEYSRLMRESGKSGTPLQDLEMETFGATHQGIGGYLFSLWGLPNSIVESVAAHHSFENCSLANNDPRQFVFAADWIFSDRDDVELVEMIDRCDDQTHASNFAQKIIEWRKRHSRNHSLSA